MKLIKKLLIPLIGFFIGVLIYSILIKEPFDTHFFIAYTIIYTIINIAFALIQTFYEKYNEKVDRERQGNMHISNTAELDNKFDNEKIE